MHLQENFLSAVAGGYQSPYGRFTLIACAPAPQPLCVRLALRLPRPAPALPRARPILCPTLSCAYPRPALAQPRPAPFLPFAFSLCSLEPNPKLWLGAIPKTLSGCTRSEGAGVQTSHLGPFAVLILAAGRKCVKRAAAVYKRASPGRF